MEASKQTKEVKPILYILHALIVFGFLGLEFAVFLVSHLIDGRSIQQLFSWPIHWYGAVAHWVLTMLVWGTGIFLYYRWAKKRALIPTLIQFNFSKREGIVLGCGVLFVVIYTVIYSQITGAVIPQVYREYTGFQRMYGEQAWIASIFQNLYYLVEFTLVIIMVAFFQRAGELWFKKEWIPWGSLGLFVTWGSIHLLSHPQGALGVMIWSLVPGIAFVAAKKSFWPVLIISVLGFIL
jgi:hypothetical protein